MSKDKFKINDRVKFVNRLAHERDPKFYPPVGTTGTIVQCDGDGYPKVRWDDEHDHNRVKFPNDQYLALVPDSSKVLIMIDKKDPAKVVARDLSSNKTGEARCNPEDTFDFFIGAALALGRLFDYEAKISGFGLEKPKQEEPKYAPCKFQVGEEVVGNAKANRYGITKEGWHGTVTAVLEPREGTGCDRGHVVNMRVEGFPVADDAFEPYVPKCFAKESKLWNAKLVCIQSCVRWWTKGKIYPVVDGEFYDDDGDVRRYGSLEQAAKNLDRYARFVELKE